MNFVADESVDYPIITRLRKDGHVILAVVELDPSISDDDVLELANQQGFVLLTGDRDFGEMVFRDDKCTFGIVLVRLSGLTATTKAEIVAATIREHADDLVNAFTVITPNSIRIRPRFL